MQRKRVDSLEKKARVVKTDTALEYYAQSEKQIDAKAI